MPRQGRLWRWSTNELDLAVLALYERHPDGEDFTFAAWEVHVVADAITGVDDHGLGLLQALRREHRIEVVDRTHRQKFRYKIRVTDGEQAQRPSSHPD